MSEPAAFVLIRDGEKRYYADRWAAPFLFREIVWGPDEFEKWASLQIPMDEWSDDVSGGVVVDFDRRQLVWTGSDGPLNIPKVAAVYDQLLQTAWPGFHLQLAAAGLPDLAKAADVSHADDYDSSLKNRSSTIRDAAGIFDDDDGDNPRITHASRDRAEDNDDDDSEADGADADDEQNGEDGDPYGEGPRAWVTIIDAGGAVRHRQIAELSEDLLSASKGVIEAAIQLGATEVPPESLVSEGMWVDQPRREIGVWGGPRTRHVFPTVKSSWSDWKVRWAEGGYVDQCQIGGPCGIPMSETDALGQILPTILSTKRFDVANVLGAVGSYFKRMAMILTAALLILICIPVLIFGLISGNWQAAFITIGIVCVLVVILFKIVELRFKKRFAANMNPIRQAGSEEVPPVAGPLDKNERRRRVGELLRSAGFPSLAEIEPKFSKVNALDLLE